MRPRLHTFIHTYPRHTHRSANDQLVLNFYLAHFRCMQKDTRKKMRIALASRFKLCFQRNMHYFLFAPTTDTLLCLRLSVKKVTLGHILGENKTLTMRHIKITNISGSSHTLKSLTSFCWFTQIIFRQLLNESLTNLNGIDSFVIFIRHLQQEKKDCYICLSILLD